MLGRSDPAFRPALESRKVAFPEQNLWVFPFRERSVSVPLTVPPETVPRITAVAYSGGLATNFPPNLEFLIVSAGNPQLFTYSSFPPGQRSSMWYLKFWIAVCVRVNEIGRCCEVVPL